MSALINGMAFNTTDAEMDKIAELVTSTLQISAIHSVKGK